MAKKEAIMKKVLSCFFIMMILMSVVPTSIFASANSNITSNGLSTTQSTPQSNAESLKRGLHILSSDLRLTRADYNMGIAVEDVSKIGRYTEATAAGKKLLYGYPDAGTSYTTIQIDGNDYYQDTTMDSYVTQMPTIIEDSVVTKWTLPPNVKVSQDLTLMPKTTRYRLTVTNNDHESHYVKIRYMFDTMLAFEDGAPFRVPGVGDITTEREFINPVFDYWSAMDSLANPTLTSYCAFVPYSKPYKVQFVYWRAINDVPFDYAITAGQSITSDTAVGMYWDLGTLVPGEIKDAIVYYGTQLEDIEVIIEGIEIMGLSTEFDSYLPGKTMMGYTYIGNGGNVPLVDGQLATTITNPKNELVFETSSPISINPDQTISPTFTYNLPVDAVGGIYTINATIYDAEHNVLDQRESTFSVTTIDLSISPEDIVTSIGGSAEYAMTITNPSDIVVLLNLNLTGLDDSWYRLSKESLILNAGEEETVILNVTIPESPDNVGEYSFNVFAGAKSVSAVLNVGLEPIIYELSPPNDVVMSSNDIIFSWKTSVNSTTELYIKQETEADFTQVSGDRGLVHSVTVGDLTRNTNYIWHIRSCTAFACAVSEDRAFYIDNGIVFTQDIYAFSVKRDYDQHCFVSVKNMDSEAHDLLVRAFNPYDDLYFGFIGGGSADQIISLDSDETKEIELVIHAQDAMLEDYTFAVNLTNLGAENITDYALVHVNVRHPHIDYDITEVSTDPITLSKTIRITNRGDPVTDLSLTPDEKLKGDVIIQPSLAHCSLETGESVDIVISPIWSEGIRYIHGTVAATVADQSRELSVDYSCREGKEMYEVTLNHPILYYDLRGAWCINCHHVEDIFNLPPGFGQENVVYAYIGMELAARSGQTRPYNVYIAVNGHPVGTLSNTFPRGYYEFDIDSSYLNYATAGTAENRYTLDTDMPGSYMTPLSNVRVVMCLDELKLHICAESAEQAEEIAWSAPYIHEPSGSITVNVLSPEEGGILNLNQPVLIKAEVLGEGGERAISKVKATFSNGEDSIYFGEGDDNGIYENTWTPKIIGNCDITVTADSCAASGSDKIPISIVYGHLPPTAIIDLIIPNPAKQWEDTISFEGSGTDEDGSVVAYEWRSDKDGVLSTFEDFTKTASELSGGTHTIYFKVQDDDGEWSTEDTETLVILPTPPTIEEITFEGYIPEYKSSGFTVYRRGTYHDALVTRIAMIKIDETTGAFNPDFHRLWVVYGYKDEEGYVHSEGTVVKHDLDEDKIFVVPITLDGDAFIGNYVLHAEIEYKGAGGDYGRYNFDYCKKDSDPFFVIFNPWSFEDRDVWNPDFNDVELDHYVTGTNDYGYYGWRGETVWTLSPTNPNVFETAMETVSLDRSAKDVAYKIANKVSCNAGHDGNDRFKRTPLPLTYTTPQGTYTLGEDSPPFALGIIAGKWFDMDCRECDLGTDVKGENNAPDVITIWKNDPRPLVGQCMQFGGLGTALLRSVGIPSRIVTAHGGKIASHPTWTWNFHVWSEAWINDPTTEDDWLGLATTYQVGPKPVSHPLFQTETMQNTGNGDVCADDVFVYDPIKHPHKQDILSHYQPTSLSTLNLRASANSQVQITVTTDKSQYALGEDVVLNVTVTNDRDTQITNNLTTIVTDYQDYGVMRAILYDAQLVSIPAHSSITKTHVITQSTYKYNGFYEAILHINGISTETYFNITGGLNLTVIAPETVDTNEIFNVVLETKNILNTTMTNIEVKVDFPYYANVKGPLSFTIPTLAPGATNITTWSVSIPVSGIHSVGFQAISDRGDFVYLLASSKVLSDPQIGVDIKTPSSVVVGSIFNISAKISNKGDYVENNVVANLDLIGNLSTAESLSKTVGSILNKSSKIVNWTIAMDDVGVHTVLVNASGDSSCGIGCAIIVGKHVGDYQIDLSIDDIGDDVYTTSLESKSSKYDSSENGTFYGIRVQNEGLNTDNVTLSVSVSSADWSVALISKDTTVVTPYTLTLTPDSERNITLNITPINLSKKDGVTVVISGVSENDPSKRDVVVAYLGYIPTVVLFDESHAETYSIAPNAKYSYSKLASLLEHKGYEAKTLDSMPITKEKLTNCSIFVISAPTKPFDTAEINAIREFVSNNGSLLLINEWGGDFRQGSNLNEIAENFGIVFRNDLVNDPTNNFHSTPSYALIHEFRRHYITKGVKEFLYPAGCSLVTNNSIAWADDDSCTTLPKIPIQALAEEEPGTITVLAATNFESGRVVCIGDGDFCGDLDIDGDGRANIDEYDNKKLILNIVEWLSGGAINEPPVASFSHDPDGNLTC